MSDLVEHAHRLMQNGYDHQLAWSIAGLQEAVSRWPAEWGDELEVLVGGDFLIPESDLVFPDLRITVFHEKLTKATVFGYGPSVLRVRIGVPERSITGFADAIQRLNLLLGSHAVACWGASGISWWCWLTGVVGGGHRVETFCETSRSFIDRLSCLQQPVRKRIEAALYWIREPRSHIGEASRPDTIRAFNSYWTAFECLVAAACDVEPLSAPSQDKLRDAAADVCGGCDNAVDHAAIGRLHRLVNPGFPTRARHALRTFVGQAAERLIYECFEHKDRGSRLNQVRNEIVHGGINAEDPIEQAQLGSHEATLRKVVWSLLEGLLGRA